MRILRGNAQVPGVTIRAFQSVEYIMYTAESGSEGLEAAGDV